MDLIPAKKTNIVYPENCHMRANMMAYIATRESVIHPDFRNPRPIVSNKVFMTPMEGLYIHAHNVAVITNEREKGSR